MRKINDYGVKLRDDFTTKTGMSKDVENGSFLGTLFYECQINDLNDAVGWMLETYDTDAVDVLDEWIENGSLTAWSINIHTIKRELEKSIT